MAALCLFRDTYMAAVTSRENTLYKPTLLFKYEKFSPSQNERTQRFICGRADPAR